MVKILLGKKTLYLMACIQASYLLDSKKQDSKKHERAKRKVMVIASNSKALYS
jgi:hypothetical protein